MGTTRICMNITYIVDFYTLWLKKDEGFNSHSWHYSKSDLSLCCVFRPSPVKRLFNSPNKVHVTVCTHVKTNRCSGFRTERALIMPWLRFAVRTMCFLSTFTTDRRQKKTYLSHVRNFQRPPETMISWLFSAATNLTSNHVCFTPIRDI